MGSVSSSGVVNAILDFYEFDEQVKNIIFFFLFYILFFFIFTFILFFYFYFILFFFILFFYFFIICKVSISLGYECSDKLREITSMAEKELSGPNRKYLQSLFNVTDYDDGDFLYMIADIAAE